ncbi:MAG TPA: hypothetical protein VFV50_18375 [Bdellovibrionales bacterium]|nr:hypothetical protein [Bdellovibrionales bacterium]
MRIAILFFTALLALPTAFARSGGETGNGGDPLMMLFEESRHQAVQRVLNATYCAFPAQIRPPIREWILNNKTELARDIMDSKHVWLAGQQVTCAYTQPRPKADVMLSFQSCRPNVVSVIDAGRTLIHESVHHLGITDEVFPSEVAYAVYVLGTGDGCTVPPAQDPFDPASCLGAAITDKELYDLLPLPHAVERTLGSYKVFMRERVCYRPDRCTKWEIGIPTIEQKMLGNVTEAPNEGLVTAYLRQDRVMIGFKSRDNSYSVLASPKKPAPLFYWNQNGGSATVRLDDYGPRRAINTLGTTALKQVSWLSRQCARIHQADTFNWKDKSGNTVRFEWDIVFLSHFNY